MVREGGRGRAGVKAIAGETEFMLDGDLHELRRLAASVDGFCHERGLADGVAFDLNLALEELFVNAVRHGGCDGMPNAARVRLQLREDGVAVEIADRGAPFDPTAAPAPDLETPLEERPSGGLGIHLVREIMRDVRYTRAGGWNRVTMRRPLAD